MAMAGAQHVFTAVCLKSLLAADSSLFSLIDIVEHIGFVHANGDRDEKDDQLVVHMEILSTWTRADFATPGTCLSRLEVVAPNQEILRKWEHPIDLSQLMWERVRYVIDVLPLREFGRHEVRVYQRDTEDQGWGVAVAVYPILMRMHEPAMAPS